MICIACINNTDCPNRFPFDGHTATFKFLIVVGLKRELCMKTEMNIYSYCVSNAGTSSAEVGRLGKFHKTLKKNELEHFYFDGGGWGFP